MDGVEVSVKAPRKAEVNRIGKPTGEDTKKWQCMKHLLCARHGDVDSFNS